MQSSMKPSTPAGVPQGIGHESPVTASNGVRQGVPPKIDDVLTVPGGLLHVLSFAVHLRFILLDK